MNPRIAPFVQYRRLFAGLVVLLFCAVTQAQNAASFQGVIVSGPGDKGSIRIVDKSGTVTELQIGPNTSFVNNKTPVPMLEVIRFGMDVRGTLAGDGSVAQVSARGVATQLDLAQIPAFLGVSPEEWKVLAPRIERIQALQHAVEGKSTNNNTAAGGRPQPASIQLTFKELQDGFFNQSPNLVHQLAAFRAEKAKVTSELAAARTELTGLLTARQETLLVILKILE